MRHFSVGQRIICEMDLLCDAETGNGFRFFTAGNEYTVSTVTPGGNVACFNDDGMEHYLGRDAEDDPSWSNHFRAAYVEAIGLHAALEALRNLLPFAQQYAERVAHNVRLLREPSEDAIKEHRGYVMKHVAKASADAVAQAKAVLAKQP